jgi:Resolvase, N terminal domain
MRFTTMRCFCSASAAHGTCGSDEWRLAYRATPIAEKSVTRQIEHAQAYAARKGWAVDPARVYVDDGGISGAEFVKRPGFLRLMDALKARPPFQILIVSEESRLGREQIETACTLKPLLDAGVRAFFYLEDRERTPEFLCGTVSLKVIHEILVKTELFHTAIAHRCPASRCDRRDSVIGDILLHIGC